MFRKKAKNDDWFEKLLKDLKTRPKDFIITEYTLNDRKTDMEIWVNGGFWFFAIWRPREIGFTFVQKIKFSLVASNILSDYNRALKELKRSKKENINNLLKDLYYDLGED